MHVKWAFWHLRGARGDRRREEGRGFLPRLEMKNHSLFSFLPKNNKDKFKP